MPRQRDDNEIETYMDRGVTYLQLHALRAPLGPYYGAFSGARDTDSWAYENAVAEACDDFEREHDVALYQLGRSGRHICIDDTPKNRRNYNQLRDRAVYRARELWAYMRDPAREKG